MPRRLLISLIPLLVTACSDGLFSSTTVPTTPGLVTTEPASSTPSSGAVETTPGTGRQDIDAEPRGAAVGDPRALDGDSLEAVVNGNRVEIRLLGINAPERDECWDSEAKAALADAAAGTLLIDPVGGEDRFGRVLAYLWNADGRLVNLDLVAAGYAIALDGDHGEVPAFLEAEEVAYRSGAGLWDPEACGPGAAPAISIAEVEPDPPGRDYGNEYVRLRNDGAGAADLAGWTVRDESSSHRFVFPPNTTIGPGDSITLRSGCGDSGGDLFWWECDHDPVWSNDGDMVLVLDPFGNVATRHRYP